MSRQTVTSGNSWFRAANQWSLNADDKDNEQFSALDTLEQHRDASGAFTLKLVFPGTDSAPQTWKQTTNPVTASQGGVAGYEPIDVPHTGCYWGGLERGGGSSLLDGSVNSGNWWYAVGARTSHGGGIPGPCSEHGDKVVQQLELWVLSSWASLAPPPSTPPPSLPPPPPPPSPPPPSLPPTPPPPSTPPPSLPPAEEPDSAFGDVGEGASAPSLSLPPSMPPVSPSTSFRCAIGDSAEKCNCQPGSTLYYGPRYTNELSTTDSSQWIEATTI